MQIDPVTFEVLRHRLWSINEEAAAALRNVSGSSVVTEVNDFNTALMNADGDELLIGSSMLVLGTPGQIVKRVLSDYSDNPGISPEDMFICSDPYSGAIHQNDVTLVAPIHWGEKLLGWCSSTLHYVDVGGSEAGSQASLGATSIYEEAMPIPPFKLIERGVLRRDLERQFLIRSRTQELNALDLRAQIAAATAVKSRVHALIAKYGLGTLEAFVLRFVENAASHFRKRLLEIPDGQWRHTQFLDVNSAEKDDLYAVQVHMIKQGDRLTLDFRGSSRQAPALVNTTPVGVKAAVLASLLVNLCYNEIPWCPAGIMSCVDVLTEKGTIVDAEWPAGCCKATTSILPMINTGVHVCLANMLTASASYQDRAMAPWFAVSGAEELFGTDQLGRPFGVTLLDTLAGGGGARSFMDGIDMGGTSRSLSLSISNVETYESRYPLLYLHRRAQPDSGGAGRYRGGAGISAQYIPWGTQALDMKIVHACGVTHPATLGLCGGWPGGTNMFLIKRDTDIHDFLREGKIPSDLDELRGRLEILPGLCKTSQRRDDVYHLVTGGGGGYGDPVTRDPAKVLDDLLSGLVSRESAREIYGVVIASNQTVDRELTEKSRTALREARSQRARKTASDPDRAAGPWGCQACGYGTAASEHRESLGYETGLREAGPWVNPYRLGSDRFTVHWQLCPSCLSVLDLAVGLKGEPRQ